MYGPGTSELASSPGASDLEGKEYSGGDHPRKASVVDVEVENGQRT